MVAHRQRLDEGRPVQRDVPDRVHPTALDDDLLRETAAAAAQPDEVHVG
ncbi:hypothetical protein [Streptomyces nodosus]